MPIALDSRIDADADAGVNADADDGALDDDAAPTEPTVVAPMTESSPEPTTALDEIIATRTRRRIHPVGDAANGCSGVERGRARHAATRAISPAAVAANHAHSSRNSRVPICTTAVSSKRPVRNASDSAWRWGRPIRATTARGNATSVANNANVAPMRADPDISW